MCPIRHKWFFTQVYSRVLLIALGMALMPGCAYVNVSLKDTNKPLQERTVSGKGFYKILIIEVSGFISSQEVSDSLLSGGKQPSLVSRIKEQLEKAEKDKRVRAVVLRINSPGGMVTASDIIYHEIKSFGERTHRPVIASLMGLATSGAYYISLAADRIIAHPTTVTGSIGVIMIRADIEGLLQKIGVRATEITSGELKAMGSFLKPLSPQEHKLFQGVIDEMYERFLKVTADGRVSLNPEKVRRLADGRIYTARQALDTGLIDAIGYLPDAIESARQMAGLKRAKVIMYHRPGDFKGSIFAGSPSPLGPGKAASILQGLTTPHFLYLWTP